MPRFAPFLALLVLFSCSKNSEEIAPPVVGHWTLVAQQDSGGAWANFIPFVPVQFEFRADGSFDYVEPNGKPQRGCCQPTQYSFAAGTPVTSVSSYWVPSLITFTSWVSCPNVYCAPPIKTWVVLQVTEQFLDLDLNSGQTGRVKFRYQRIR